MWEAWKISKAYRLRPSELYGIKDELKAWSFDRAVWLFGSNLEAELEEAANDAKNKGQAESKQRRVLAKWLGGGVQQYRDPGGSAAPGATSSQTSGPVSL